MQQIEKPVLFYLRFKQRSLCSESICTLPVQRRSKIVSKDLLRSAVACVQTSLCGVIFVAFWFAGQT